jgi:mono/diheme cytochrome c family protein
MRRVLSPPSTFFTSLAGVLLVLATLRTEAAAETTAAVRYHGQIAPLIQAYCGSCHTGGEKEGGLALDAFADDAARLADAGTWWKVLKNVRSGVMPPPGEPRPTAAEVATLGDWIKRDVFRIDPANVDPGQLTIRRLNRQEYRSTIAELMGIDFNAEVVFPEDDSGFGFDNVGDALSLSPLLMEKYLRAAEAIVTEAVPTVTWITPRIDLSGRDFRDRDRNVSGDRVDVKKPATLKHVVTIPETGQYQLDIELRMHGSFDFDPARCTTTILLDGEELHRGDYGWDENKPFRYRFPRELTAGEHELRFELTPLVETQRERPAGEFGDATSVHQSIRSVQLEGPLNVGRHVHPRNYDRFFPRDDVPDDPAARREYAAEVLGRFARRAYRCQVDEATVVRLVGIAESVQRQSDKTFEQGIAQAMAAVLASPRFLFRFESPDPITAGEQFPLVDEFGLASRLSYFLWSSMPDEELFRLVEQGRLREQFPAQVERLLKDQRANEFISNFVGQWLRARDVRNVSIDPVAVFGHQKEYEELLQQFRSRRGRRGQETPEQERESQRVRERFREFRALQDKMNDETRQAMRRETELCFEHIVREDRSLLELIDADYTFLNERLADLYGIPDVRGSDMRRVSLPADSPRGGVLTQGTMLVVTSNPTRTSPVKRGLFVLENLLGTPAPPAPDNVPLLEDAADQFGGREPQLRELLAKHRESALCASCHARMDPLGLALENFNAMGVWRDAENGLPIDPSGELLSGAKFRDVRELKQILVNQHRQDYYRCVTQKLLTFALGRGLDYADEHTVDIIVERLEQNGGQFSALLQGVVESAPFQRIRNPQFAVTANTPPVTKGHP